MESSTVSRSKRRCAAASHLAPDQAVRAPCHHDGRSHGAVVGDPGSAIVHPKMDR
ncbi:MAG: hypothetical protein MZU97_12445 [Bacillus subtilis]|nr:hypothetical protein [Bacillus subtilis]